MRQMRWMIALPSVLLAGCALFQPGGSSSLSSVRDDEARCQAGQSSLERAATRPSSSSLDALYWCTRGAERGSAKSQYLLAGMYEKGLGVSRNQKEAIRWYQQSAQLGDPEAQFKLGLIYGRGEGVAKNGQQATRWYLQAAQQGHAEAQFYMGYRYQHGKGVARDYGEALRWYEKSADQGNASALNYLGVMTEAGQGVPQNDAVAYQWFNLAAVSGFDEYMKNRDRLARKLTARQLEEGQRLASQWAARHPRIVKSGDPG